MKKFLLTMACALGLMTASAEEVTFDFSTADAAGAYGIPTDKNTYVTNPTTVTNGAVSLTFDGSAKEAWRWWDDGMRAYGKSTAKKPTLTVSVNGGTITNISIDFGKTGAIYSANVGTWTLNDNNTGGVWTGDNASVTLSMTASSNIASGKTITVTYTGGEAPAVAAPKVSCADNTVTITADGADAIYYTLDNTEPTNASTKYTAPFPITENTTVKAIAYKGADKSGVTTFNAQYEGTYADFAAFVAANTTGTVAGPIAVAYQSSDKRYTYLKDSKGGWMLAFTSNTNNSNPELVNGDILASITGKYSPYNKLPEMVPAEWGAVTKGAAVEPTELTAEELSLDMVNEYVVLKNVSISGVNGKNFTITDETGTTAGYNTIGLTEIPEGEGFTLYGFVSRFNDNLQIAPVKIEGGQVMETVATPTFSVESGAVAAGTAVEIACATEGAAIFYTIDGTEPTASSTLYENAITINANTTVKAIAIKEGMIDSQVAVAEYAIIAAGAKIATFDFTTTGVTDFTTSQITADNTQNKEGDANDLANVKFINEEVTVYFIVNSGSAPRWWKGTQGDTELRFYNGTTLVVSVNKDGYKLVDVKFEKGFGSNFPTAEQMTITPDNGTFADRVWTAPTDNCTEMRLETTKTANVGKLIVNYEEAEGAKTAVENIALDDANAPAEYFNLQGVRVANPTPGLYIVRQGNKTSKVLVK